MKSLAQLLMIALCLAPALAPAGDLAREQRLAAELAEAANPGHPVELAAGEQKVLALLAEETRGELQGGIILLHDLDAHADWPEVIGPLRRALPETGWTTLSVQLPLPLGGGTAEMVKLLDEARPRIDAAVAHLAGIGIHNVVLLGHGFGAIAAADFLSENTSGAVRGLVAVGMVSYPEHERLDALKLLPKLRWPVLDIFGSRDRREVTDSADRRAAAVRKTVTELTEAPVVGPDMARTYGQSSPGRILYRQLIIPGADHGFSGQEELLSSRVRGWLKRHATGVRVHLRENP